MCVIVSVTCVNLAFNFFFDMCIMCIVRCTHPVIRQGVVSSRVRTNTTEDYSMGVPCVRLVCQMFFI